MFNLKPSPKDFPKSYLFFTPPLLNFLLSLPLVLLLGMASAQTDPCSLTATHTIANGQTVNVSTWFPSSSSTSNEVIDIGAGATLVIDQSFAFNTTKFRCAANASIVTQGSGVIFGLTNSTMLSCNSSTMWTGITVSVGTRINFTYNWIYDATRALYFPPGYNEAKNVLRFTRFIDNQIGMQVGSVLGSPANVAFTLCSGNKFTEDTGLNDTSLGTHVVTGIRVDNSNLAFGTGGFRNIFEGMLTGMTLRKGAYVWVANSDFKNMIRNGTGEVFPLIPTQGTGIYLSSSHLTVSRVSGGSNCRFLDNLSHGIYSTNHNGEIKVERADFSGSQRYGIFINQSLIPAPVIIQDNSFTLDNARCYSAIFCSRPPGNASATSSYIRGNQITVPDLDSNTQPRGALIDVAGIAGTAGSNNFEISNNTIHSLNYKDEDRHGIYITGTGDNYIVQFNNLHYDGINAVPPGHDYSNLGISFVEMPGIGNTIYHNTIKSVLTHQITGPVGYNHRSIIKCGIHVYSNNAPTICDNDIDSTYRGAHFGEANLGAVFGLNQMKHHVYGLHFRRDGPTDPLTNIGDQIRRENTWSTNAADYIDTGVGAIYADAGTPPFVFRYDPNSGITGQLPPSATPAVSTWFNPESGVSNPCARVASLFEDSEIAIAAGEYPYITSAEDWDLQRHLWNKLLRDPGIEAGVTEVEDFMGDPKDETSPQLFARALYDYEKAFYPDSVWQIQWNTILGGISSKQNRVAGMLTQLSLDTLNVDPDYADSLSSFWTSMALYQDTLRTLVDTFTAKRDMKLLALISEMSTLPIDNDWEKAWIKIIEFAIGYGQGIETDSLRRVDLLGIAGSCPADVGKAAHAVLAYMHPDDASPFKGCGKITEACTEERSVHTHNQEADALLFPNPAHQRLTVLFGDSDSGGNWKIMSVSGTLITQGIWAPGESLISLDVSAYSNGMYLFQTKSASGRLSAKKFTIVK